MKKLKDTKLVIMLTSDIHGNIFPINYCDNSYKPQGLTKIATLIKQIRDKNQNTILIDNGDLIQGTPLTYHYCKINSVGVNPMMKVLNHLQYDAMVVGNHEFNYGLKILFDAQRESNFSWLAANILNESDKKCTFGKPYIIKQLDNGIKIGVLGVTTEYIPNWEDSRNIEGLIFENALKATEKWVSHLRNIEQVDVVIVSYHGSFEKDINTEKEIGKFTGENQAFEICQKVKGIDILLSGHQHRVIENKHINNVLVLQSGSHGKYLGVVNVIMQHTDKWHIKNKSSWVEAVKDIEEDPAVISMMKEYEIRAQQWLDTPIGFIKGGMAIENPLQARLKECLMVEFINRVQMNAADVEISCTSLFVDELKGIKEQVTMRDIVSNYIYPNTLRVLRLKGKDIKAALERSAGYFERYDGKEIKVKKKDGIYAFQPYNYDMWEGIEYKINITKEEGNRIEDLSFRGKTMDMEGDFEVVMNNYRAAGGGEYTMFKNKAVLKDIPIDVSELIANYIIEKGVISSEVNNNWKVIY